MRAEKGENPTDEWVSPVGTSEEPAGCLIIVPPSYGKVGYSSTGSHCS